MSDEKKHILFLIRDLNGGGAERSFLNILINLDRQCYEPHLVLWHKAGAYLDEIPEDVPLYFLPSTSRSGLFRHVLHIRALATLIERLKADIVLSFDNCHCETASVVISPKISFRNTSPK